MSFLRTVIDKLLNKEEKDSFKREISEAKKILKTVDRQAKNFNKKGKRALGKFEELMKGDSIFSWAED